MKRSLYIISVLMILAWESTTSAYEPEQAINNYAHDLATCSAYYMLTSKAPGLDDSTSKKSWGVGMSLSLSSAQLSSEKLALARVELEIKSMQREMEGTWDNISILLNKYGYFCKDLVEKPESRLQYWIDK